MGTRDANKTGKGCCPSDESFLRSPEFQNRLNRLYRLIYDAQGFVEVLPEIERELLDLMRAERLTIYQRGRHDREIVSRYKTGNEVNEIRLPLSTASIAGYVALTHKALRIDDVHDGEFLTSIHPNLRFDYRYDQRSGFRTRSMIVLPIKSGEVLLGVLQIINRLGGIFKDEDTACAVEVARLIGQKFRYDLQGTRGPFDYLLETGRITPEKLERCKQQAAARKVGVGQMLLTEMLANIDEIGVSLEHYYQVPFMKYDPDLELPRAVMRKLSEAYLRKNLWVPVACDHDTVVVLIDDPNDTGRIMEIQSVLNMRSYEFRVGLPEDILRFLGAGLEVPAASINLEELVERLEDERSAGHEPEISVASLVRENEAAVVQIVNQLILDADRLGASDIHIEPNRGKQPAEVRMRVDGVCRSVLKVPSSHARAVVARIKVLSRLDIAESRRPQDGKFTARLHNKALEIRVATLPTVNGEGAVLRLLKSGRVLHFDGLNLTDRNRHAIRRLISHPHGIFLVVGPTGSGKTTTLHAILSLINSPEIKIWTAEDPVEITQAGLQQIQVNPRIGLDFAGALRSFLRADPDVILIGEIRDPETAQIAIRASLTGHLVFSTLHTNSAPETVTRLLDLGLDPRNFADALMGVLAQRLVRTLCEGCKQPYRAGTEEIEQLAYACGGDFLAGLGIDQTSATLYKPVGCEKCGGTGYRGRTGIHELLVATEGMKLLIGRRGGVAEIRELARNEGMRSLMQDGVAKVLAGATDFAQLRRAAPAC
jgi:type II secretory ATPase GspE/PulE/Tfp pilus assembly ATPase PilB-like protein/putative methionine-R-sulfoxide reductase with GAF domain